MVHINVDPWCIVSWCSVFLFFILVIQIIVYGFIIIRSVLFFYLFLSCFDVGLFLFARASLLVSSDTRNWWVTVGENQFTRKIKVTCPVTIYIYLHWCWCASSPVKWVYDSFCTELTLWINQKIWIEKGNVPISLNEIHEKTNQRRGRW